MLRRRMMMGQSGNADYSKMYLTTKALESGTITFTRSGSGGISYYSLDGTSWTSFSSTYTATVNEGDEVQWKVTGATPATDGTGMGAFSSTCNFEVLGNVMSMQDGDDFANSLAISNNHQFRALFKNATKLINAQNLVLPATNPNGKYAIYANMFESCSALVTAPAAIPLSTVTANSCQRMFRYCAALVTAPELPAATLENYAYEQMFNGCTPLAYIKCLATTISATSSTNSWLNGVAATGTFVKAASMTSWSTGTSGIPSGWTVENA